MMSDENKKKRKKQIILVMLLVIGLASITLGVSIAFFNYTRTGSVNNLGTGRIYFNSTQNGALNMTNVFPMTSTQAGTAQLDTVTVGIVGDTTYANGEEFLISLVDVTNTVNGKKVPLNYIATYEAAENKTIGINNVDYYTARESKDATIYKLNATGMVGENEKVLVGYINDGATGVNGTLTIKAYIDADRIAISDTYPEGTIRTVKITEYSSSNCETALTGVQDASTYCASASSLQDAIDNEDLTSAQVTLLVNAGLVEEYTNGTTSNWVNGRTVLTTAEWNSLGSTPISFKIKAESNEGIWVPPEIASCPGCKYLYFDSGYIYTTWNVLDKTPTVFTNGLSDDYREVVNSSGKNYFAAVKLNSDNQVTNIYACGVKGNVPFCLQGDRDGSNYSANSALLQGESLWNNTCQVYIPSGLEIGATECIESDYSLHAEAVSNGNVHVYGELVDGFFTDTLGILYNGEVD